MATRPPRPRVRPRSRWRPLRSSQASVARRRRVHTPSRRSVRHRPAWLDRQVISYVANRPCPVPFIPSHDVRCAERSGVEGAEKLDFAPDIQSGKGVRVQGASSAFSGASSRRAIAHSCRSRVNVPVVRRGPSGPAAAAIARWKGTRRWPIWLPTANLSPSFAPMSWAIQCAHKQLRAWPHGRLSAGEEPRGGAQARSPANIATANRIRNRLVISK